MDLCPPSVALIAHGLPGSSGAATSALLRPLRLVRPIGWIGGKYSTSNPISATSARRASQSANVPCSPPDAAERGNISYHALKRANGGSTQSGSVGAKVLARRLSA